MDWLKVFLVTGALVIGCNGYNINYDFTDQQLTDFIARTVRIMLSDQTHLHKILDFRNGPT